jgi:hypothetical protein
MRYNQCFMFFCNWCFGEIDTIFIDMQINIDRLTHSISKGNKKKICKKTKMETISHENEDKEIIDVSLQDGEYNDDISDMKVFLLNVLLQSKIL